MFNLHFFVLLEGLVWFEILVSGILVSGFLVFVEDWLARIEVSYEVYVKRFRVGPNHISSGANSRNGSIGKEDVIVGKVLGSFFSMGFRFLLKVMFPGGLLLPS